MSPMKRYANKQAKARKRRRLKAQERLQQQRAQAQHSIEAIHQALKDLDFPDTLVAEIEGRLQAQQLLLGLQAAFNLGYQRIGKIQVFEGLMDGLDRVLGLSTLLLEAFLGFESTAFSGFGLFVSVSFHRGHGELLRTVLGFRLGSEETMPHSGRILLMIL